MAYQSIQQIQNTASTETGQIDAVGEVINYTNSMGSSSWSVQVTGTFIGSIMCEASLDGVNFVPIAYRQSQTGTISNTIKSSGIFRGVLGGINYFRLRSTAWTSGVANVTITSSTGAAAVFPNTILEVRSVPQYAVSSAGGKTGFAGSSGMVSIPNAGSMVCVIRNPTGSGFDLYMNSITLSSNKPGRWERIRGVTVNATGTSLGWANRGGGSLISPIQLYLPSAATVTGGVLAEALHLYGFFPHTEEIDGEAIIGPSNQSTSFHFYPDPSASPTTQATTAAVSFTYWLQENNSV